MINNNKIEVDQFSSLLLAYFPKKIFSPLASIQYVLSCALIQIFLAMQGVSSHPLIAYGHFVRAIYEKYKHFYFLRLYHIWSN